MVEMKGAIAIVGGHGQVARLLTPILVERGYRVLSIIRHTSQIEAVEALGAEAIVADIENLNARDLTPFLRGAYAVIFAAGAGPNSGAARKRTVDYGGSVLAQRAALDAGVKRFLQISAVVAGHPVDPEADIAWREYVRAKEDADKALRRTTLQWTIVRPAFLTDELPTGKVRIEERIPYLLADSLSIPRADVAQVLVDCLEIPETIRRAFDLGSGDTPIAEALRNLR